jgi:hypothetical protein
MRVLVSEAMMMKEDGGRGEKRGAVEWSMD